VLGVAMSHVRVWSEAAGETVDEGETAAPAPHAAPDSDSRRLGFGLREELDYVIVFEDDTVLDPDIVRRWRRLLAGGVAADPSWDLLFLGSTDDRGALYGDATVPYAADLTAAGDGGGAGGGGASGGGGEDGGGGGGGGGGEDGDGFQRSRFAADSVRMLSPGAPRFFGAGAFAYALRARGARRLLEAARAHGVRQVTANRQPLTALAPPPRANPV
jgi:hypothetical protein